VSSSRGAVAGGAGGNTTAGGSGAVPLPARCAGAGAAGFGPCRCGGGGGPLGFVSRVDDSAASNGAAAASGELPARDAGRGGGFGDSVKDCSARPFEYAAHENARLQQYKQIRGDA